MKPVEIQKVAEAVYNVHDARWHSLNNFLSDIHSKIAGITSDVAALKAKIIPPEMPPAQKLCRDCKHCRPHTVVTTYRVFLPNKKKLSYEFALCVRPNSPESKFLVSGAQEGGGYHCSMERKGDYHWLCGPKARFFEAAEVSPSEP